MKGQRPVWQPLRVWVWGNLYGPGDRDCIYGSGLGGRDCVLGSLELRV